MLRKALSYVGIRMLRSAHNNHDSRPKASVVNHNGCNIVSLLSLVFYEISSMRRPPIFKYILPGQSYGCGFLNLIHLIIRWAEELLNRSVKVLKVPGAESPGKKLHHRKIISLQTSPFECLRDRLVDVPSFASPSLRSSRPNCFALFQMFAGTGSFCSHQAHQASWSFRCG
ncbi:MAG: hypothetical protein RL160_1214 [Bacteroidota bacterium]